MLTSDPTEWGYFRPEVKSKLDYGSWNCVRRKKGKKKRRKERRKVLSVYSQIFAEVGFNQSLYSGLLNFLELSQPLLVFRSEYKIVKQKSFNGEVIYASVLQKMITKERANQNASLERLLPWCFAL